MSQEKVVLPHIIFENRNSFEGSLSIPERVARVLTSGGFEVEDVREGSARMVPGKVPVTLYTVRLPKEWSCKVPAGWEGEKNLFLVDEKGQWRAEVLMTMHDDPVETRFFCRYSVLSGSELNWFVFNPTLHEGEKFAPIVIDRSCASSKDPYHITNGVVWKSLAPPGLSISPLTSTDFCELVNTFMEATEKKEWPLKREPYIWLKEKYPEWQNPFSYW